MVNSGLVNGQLDGDLEKSPSSGLSEGGVEVYGCRSPGAVAAGGGGGGGGGHGYI